VKRLDLLLFSGSVNRAPGDTLLVLVPEDERPLRGDAGEVDWRMDGELSRQLESGYILGSSGEAVLVPARAPLTARRVLLAGIGPAARLEGRPLRRACRSAAERLLSLGSDAAVLALPDAIDFEVDGDMILQACLQVLAATRGDASLRLVIPRARDRARALEHAIEALLPDAQSRRIEVAIHGVESDPLEHANAPAAATA